MIGAGCWALLAGAALLCSTASAQTAQPAQTLKLHKSSSLVVRTWKDGPTARLTHDHVMAASDFAGEASWVVSSPETLKLQVTVQARSLVADEPALRARFGLTPDLSERDRAAVDAALKGHETLDVKRYPTIGFRSKQVRVEPGGALTLSGDFTLHGTTRAVQMPITIAAASDGGVVGDAVFRIQPSAFGIRPYSAFLGAVKVKDEVEIVLHLVGVPP